MIYSQEVSNMTCVAKGIEKHGPAQFLKKANGYRLKKLKISAV